MKLSKSIGEMFERKDETHMTEVSWVPLSEQDQNLRNALRGSDGNW